MDSFKKEFDLRVDWEILSEFGLTAQLGRTLEKTGASATYSRLIFCDMFIRLWSIG